MMISFARVMVDFTVWPKTSDVVEPMQATFSQSLLHSRIARRILGLFVLCALRADLHSRMGFVSPSDGTTDCPIIGPAETGEQITRDGFV